MRIDIGGGVRLYVDVAGMGLEPVEGKMIERPTLLLLHGGPGMDHASYKLGMHQLSDVAQVVMYDHRGQGRSDRRACDEWNLDTWAADAAAAFWSDPTPDTRRTYLRVCGPLYTQQPGNIFESVETVRNDELFKHGSHGENRMFDLRPGLGRARCPVLVMAGEHDPVCPIEGSEEIVASSPAELVQFARFEHSGHGVFRDEPERAMQVLRDFVVA